MSTLVCALSSVSNYGACNETRSLSPSFSLSSLLSQPEDSLPRSTEFPDTVTARKRASGQRTRAAITIFKTFSMNEQRGEAATHTHTTTVRAEGRATCHEGETQLLPLLLHPRIAVSTASLSGVCDQIRDL